MDRLDRFGWWGTAQDFGSNGTAAPGRVYIKRPKAGSRTRRARPDKRFAGSLCPRSLTCCQYPSWHVDLRHNAYQFVRQRLIGLSSAQVVGLYICFVQKLMTTLLFFFDTLISSAQQNTLSGCAHLIVIGVVAGQRLSGARDSLKYLVVYSRFVCQLSSLTVATRLVWCHCCRQPGLPLFESAQAPNLLSISHPVVALLLACGNWMHGSGEMYGSLVPGRYCLWPS